MQRTFDRIKLDPRHRYPTLLNIQPITRRMFGDWAMALAGARLGQAVPLSAAASLDRAVANPTVASNKLIELLVTLTQTSQIPNLAKVA